MSDENPKYWITMELVTDLRTYVHTDFLFFVENPPPRF